MTDGMPTDNWGPAADNFRTRRLGKVIACAAGDQADPEILKRFVEGEENMVVQLKSLQPDESEALSEVGFKLREDHFAGRGRRRSRGRSASPAGRRRGGALTNCAAAGRRSPRHGFSGGSL